MSSAPVPGPGPTVRSPSVPGVHSVAPLDEVPGPRVDARLPRAVTTTSPTNDPGRSGGGRVANNDGDWKKSDRPSTETPGTEIETVAELSAEQYEETHVHSIYASIASHFSSTRHKPWPLVTNFLTSLTPGSVGLDVGCGNGKYLELNRSVLLLASDRSANLVGIAKRERSGPSSDVIVADTLSLPYRPRSFDFVICIAVIHHLSTRQRRHDAIATLLACIRPGGQVLVYVWALEQVGSRRGWDVGMEQDLLVPWVVKGNALGNAKGDETYQRYYHLYREGELEEDCEAAGGKILRSGYEKDNWWAVCTRDDKQEKGN